MNRQRQPLIFEPHAGGAQQQDNQPTLGEGHGLARLPRDGCGVAALPTMQAEVADAAHTHTRAHIGTAAAGHDPHPEAGAARQPRKRTTRGVVQPDIFRTRLERGQRSVEIEEQGDGGAGFKTAGNPGPGMKQMMHSICSRSLHEALRLIAVRTRYGYTGA